MAATSRSAKNLLDEKRLSTGTLQCLVIALSRLRFIDCQLLLTVQEVVSSGKRRVVDCHWQRGNIIFANRLNWS